LQGLSGFFMAQSSLPRSELDGGLKGLLMVWGVLFKEDQGNDGSLASLLQRYQPQISDESLTF